MEEFNVAYKAIPIGDGVVFLFDTIDTDNVPVMPQIKVESGGVFVVLGKNAIPVTIEILKELQAAPRAVFFECGRDSYQPDQVIGSQEFDLLFLAKMEGVLEFTPSS